MIISESNICSTHVMKILFSNISTPIFRPKENTVKFLSKLPTTMKKYRVWLRINIADRIEIFRMNQFRQILIYNK